MVKINKQKLKRTNFFFNIKKKKINPSKLKRAEEFINRVKIHHINIIYSFKNTIISINTHKNEKLKQWSTKSLKKLDRRKNSPYNIKYLCKQIVNYIKIRKLILFKIFLKGTKNYRRKFILKNLKVNDLNILSVIDNTPVVFNGCRPKKLKRK